MITREFKLYLNAGVGVAPVINANQFDQGEEWIFTLLQSDGTVYTPSTGAIIGLKQDGTTILNAGTVNESGQVVITETEQMTAVPGSNLFEILIDGNSHGTANFVVFVERRPGDIDNPSESDISLFQEAITAAGNVTQFQADISALQSGLSQETQTRQAQDTSLASQIAQEASARSQQDAVLQAEIDQIIAPTGEAPSAAEVQNARIGVDGTTYDTLGNAIRGQVSDLKNAMDHFDGAYKKFHVNANAVHSASMDQIIVSIPVGEKYILSYKRNYTNSIQFFVYDANGNGTPIGASSSTSGTLELTATIDIAKVGMTVSVNTSADDYIFTVSKAQTNAYVISQKANKEEIDVLNTNITSLMLGNEPLNSITVGKRGSSPTAYDVKRINVESGRRYRIDMSNIDALVGADLYLRIRKIDNSGNAYTADRISGDIPANTKWTYYFNCTVTESVDIQIYRQYLTEDATFSVGVLCDDDRRDISTLTSDLSFVNGKINMDVSRNLIGPDLDVLYPVPPLKTGDVITISAFNSESVNSYTHVRFCDSDGNDIKYYQFDEDYGSAGRRVILDIGDSIAYYIKLRHDCGSPLMVELGDKTDFIPHFTTNYEKYLDSQSNFGEFELSLPEQAEIIRNNLATARMARRLCFGHVSDNHSTVEKFISDIVDMSDAKFIANTGDIVQDKFQDAYTNLPAMINAMTKPYYITLGNHDVYNAPSVSDIFTKYFAPINAHNGQENLDKTYYAVDFVEEKIKCIFLNPYDALTDYSASMTTVIAGKMSATQINWFLDQLDVALTESMHVCVFLHLSPEIVGEREQKFFDVNTTDSRLVTYTFIPDVIDAFLDGGSVTFNYDGNSYAHTFASSGVFVGYFCGHMHCDCIGKLKTHNRQNAFSVTRPWQDVTNTLTDGTYRHGSSKWGSSTFNYVTVDPTTRHVSIMRVLQQDTKYGFKRDFVTMEY